MGVVVTEGVSLGSSVTVVVGSGAAVEARFGSSSSWVIEQPEKAPLRRSPSVAAPSAAPRFLVVGMASA